MTDPTPEGLARPLAAIRPGDWRKALAINATFAKRNGGGRAMRPDFRSQLVPGDEPRHPAIDAFLNRPKGPDHV